MYVCVKYEYTSKKPVVSLVRNLPIINIGLTDMSNVFKTLKACKSKFASSDHKANS